MATKSFLKNIHLKDKKEVSRLVNALEIAETHKKPIQFSRSYITATKEDVRKMFANR